MAAPPQHLSPSSLSPAPALDSAAAGDLTDALCEFDAVLADFASPFHERHFHYEEHLERMKRRSSASVSDSSGFSDSESKCGPSGEGAGGSRLGLLIWKPRGGAQGSALSPGRSQRGNPPSPPTPRGCHTEAVGGRAGLPALLAGVLRPEDSRDPSQPSPPLPLLPSFALLSAFFSEYVEQVPQEWGWRKTWEGTILKHL